MRLDVTALALTAGSLWGAAMLIIASANLIWPNYGQAFLALVASIYPGYRPGAGCCGRYRRWSRRQRIEELLGIEPSGLDDFTPLYNITPSVNTWVVRARDGKPTLHSYLWGLVSYWSKDPKREKGCEASQR